MSLTKRFTTSCLMTSLRPLTFQHKMLQLRCDIDSKGDPSSTFLEDLERKNNVLGKQRQASRQ